MAKSDNGEDIIRNVFQKCKYESAHGLQKPIELYKERVAYYTGTSELLIEILEEENNNYQLDLFDRAIISDAIHNMYLQQKTFSYKEIYAKVKDKIKIPDLGIFCSILRRLGYKPVNTLNYGKIILEDPKFTFERFRYLNKITKLKDSGRTIYYIDERIVDVSKTFKKPWTFNKDMSEIDGYTFFHIVSKNGLEKGLFCNQANAEDFSKWISDIVLSFIKESSVIVMDNSPLHGSKVTQPISKYHSKDEMLKWLQRNNIPCTPSMRKAQLYDLIIRCPYQDNQYKLDLIFKSHGHEVLRLPENYHDLSLTELLWDKIRMNTFAPKDTANLLSFKNKVYYDITTISQDTWSKFESTIRDTERNIFVIDEAIERAVDLYKIDCQDAN